MRCNSEEDKLPMSIEAQLKLFRRGRIKKVSKDARVKISSKPDKRECMGSMDTERLL
jgi:hypothetical protein